MTDQIEIKVWREFDAARINEIMNDPALYSLIALPGQDRLDATALVDDLRNVLLMTEGGGVLFCQQEPGIYEVHTNFLMSHWGHFALAASQQAYRWMFTHTDCMVLQTRVPTINQAAAKFCRIVGATLEFERDKVWPTVHGACGMTFWTLRYEDWVRKTPSLKEAGIRFHDRLNAERQRKNLDLSRHTHPDEACHDLYVGVCAEMIYAGQADKAVVLYNRWARFSGYGQIAMVSRSPLILDIGDALIQVGNDDFTVVRFKGI